MTLGEVELEIVLFGDRRCETCGHHLVDNFLLRFGLFAHVRVRTTRADEFLQVRDVSLLLFVLLLLHDVVLVHGFLECIVVTGVVCKLLLRQPNDVRTDAIQEILRVRNDYETLFVLSQVVFEPHARFEIQVIRWLVQQQKSGLGKQRLGKRDTHPPAARHVRRWAMNHGLGETERVQKLRCTRFERSRIDLF